MTVAPAFSMSPVMGGKHAVFRPFSSPYTAGTCAPWHTSAIGQVAGEEVLGDAPDVGVDPDPLGGAAPGDDEGVVALDVDLGPGHVDRQLAAVLLHVGVGVGVELVDDQLHVTRRP